MIKFISRLIAILAFTFTGFSQHGVYVKYETRVDGKGEDAEMTAMMMNGSFMEIASSTEKTWVKTQMGTMMTMVMSVDIASNEMTMLMSGIAGEMAFQGNANDLSNEEEEVEALDLELVEETKVILDVECKKAMMTDSSGNQAIYWYTEDFDRPEGMEQMPNNVPGLCLEFEVVTEGIKITYTAIEFDDEAKMEDYEIVIPEGVEVQSLEDMNKMGQ